MSTRNRSDGTPEVWWALLTAILKSMRNRPLAWLTGFWLCGWALVVWQAVHPASWDLVWGLVNSILRQTERGGGQPFSPGASVAWLQEVARWGQTVLFVSTGLLALYASYGLLLWWRYMHAWLPKVREERLRGGRVLEVLIPRGSKADARAAAGMLGQLWNLLSDVAGATGRTPVPSHPRLHAEPRMPHALPGS
jgi:hypothetical protein